MTSAVLIIPAEYRDTANSFAASMGWQQPNANPGAFSVPLGPDPETITHYGCRSDVFDRFKALLADPPAEAQVLLAVLLMDLSDTLWGNEHFDTFAASVGLQRIWPQDTLEDG